MEDQHLLLKDLCPANGRSAVLGRMPRVSRATAIKPYVKQSNRDWLRMRLFADAVVPVIVASSTPLEWPPTARDPVPVSQAYQP